VALLPGIESWYEHGNKSKSGKNTGVNKVRQVAEHVNMILRYIPYVQTNFVLGLDCDEGPEPFELTKTFMELTPGAYPAFSLLTCYGRAAPMNLDLQRVGRVLPVPFHFLNSNKLSNVRSANYGTVEFADLVSDLLAFALSPRVIARRFGANSGWTTKWLNAFRAGTSKRVRWQRTVGYLLANDPAFLDYFEGRTTILPPLLRDNIEKGLGALWPLLPEGALEHDQNAYLASSDQASDSGTGQKSSTPPSRQIAAAE